MVWRLLPAPNAVKEVGALFLEGFPIVNMGNSYISKRVANGGVMLGAIIGRQPDLPVVDPHRLARSNIVIDGACYTLHGPYNGTRENLWVIGEGADKVSPRSTIPYSVGVDLGGDASGLTITNLNIKNFSIGTYIWTKNITFVGNSVSECVVAVLLSGSENSVTRNYMMKNEVGFVFRL